MRRFLTLSGSAAVLRAILSHWRRRPGQAVTLILGLALATALWSGVQAINAEARASYDRAARVLGADQLPRLVSDAPIALETYVALRRSGWDVSPLLEGELRIGSRRYQVIGMDPVTAPSAAMEGLPPIEDGGLALLSPEGRVFAHPETADRLTGADLPPIIRAEGIAPGLLLTDMSVAERLLETEGVLSALILVSEAQDGPPRDEIAPDLRLQAPATSDVSRLTDSFHLNLTAFGFLSFAVGLFIVHGTVGLAFEQRRAMFRTLRAIGTPLAALVSLLFAEALVFGLIGGALGVVAGYFVAAALLPDVAATLSGLYGARVAGTLAIRPEWWLSGLALTLAGTVIAAAQALYRVWHLPILAAAQPRAWAMATGLGLRWQALGALALAVAGVVWLITGSGLVMGFGVLGALLLAAALAHPTLLALALSLGQRTARTPVAEWFWADTRQQLPGLSLALMALLLALAANIGVGTMVSSFRLTFTGWLDQRLASEFYVTARDEAEAARLQDWLSTRSDAVLPIWHTEGEIGGRGAEIYGIVDHATYRDNWPVLSGGAGVWDRLAAGGTALLNEQLARRADFAIGDQILLRPGWTVELVGTYSDYGNPEGQAIVRLEDLLANAPEVARLRFGIRILPEKVADLATALETEFGLPRENMVDQASIKAFSLGVFERTFTVTGALNILTLAVAGFAMLTALLTLASLRLPQVAPVWALGLTRAEIGRLELLRTVLLAAITAVAALPVGLLLAWILLAVINVEAFGWRLPMFLFPLDWLKLGGLALVAAGIAAILPMRSLARMPPARMLKVFADER